MLGTLGSGNHSLELQEVTRVFDEQAADTYGLRRGDLVLSLHAARAGWGIRGVSISSAAAYNAEAVVEVVEAVGLAKRVAALRPLICVKG